MAVDDWVKRISEQDIPVFAHTARRIVALSTEIETPLAELADVILRDSSMTARILRLANSVAYNPQGQRVTTITKAILLIGFDTVRSMALSIAMIDSLLRGVERQRVMEELAKSFHCAFQAKALAQLWKLEEVEEIFIAGLLFYLGPMAFWCFPGSCSDELDNAYVQQDAVDQQEAAELQVLGFRLQDLTRALVHNWQLSPILEHALQGPADDDKAAWCVRLAATLSQTVAGQTWDNNEVISVLGHTARRLGVSREKYQAVAHDSVRRAYATLQAFEVPQIGNLLSLPGKVANKKDETTDHRSQQEAEALLGLLRELSSMMRDGATLNSMLAAVMESIYRGLRMERVILAWQGSDHHLKAKMVLGADKDKIQQCFDFDVANSPCVFAQVMRSARGQFFDQKDQKANAGWFDSKVRTCTRGNDFFLEPLRIKGKAVGLIYADRSSGGRSLSTVDYLNFRLFAEQAEMAMNILRTPSP